jgi:hypothetical protein
VSFTILWQDTNDRPTAEELRALAEAIERARHESRHVSIETARGNAYAYPSANGSISAGINGGKLGFCILQGRG